MQASSIHQNGQYACINAPTLPLTPVSTNSNMYANAYLISSTKLTADQIIIFLDSCQQPPSTARQS